MNSTKKNQEKTNKIGNRSWNSITCPKLDTMKCFFLIRVKQNAQILDKFGAAVAKLTKKQTNRSPTKIFLTRG